MPAKIYKVDLTGGEREELARLTQKGKISARKMKRAQVLLKAAEGLQDEDIMQALSTSRSTVERTRRRFVEGGWSGHSTRTRDQDNSVNWMDAGWRT